MKIKGVVIEVDGSKLVIECNWKKHWKLEHGSDGQTFGNKGAMPPREFRSSDMPNKEVIVRLNWRDKP